MTGQTANDACGPLVYTAASGASVGFGNPARMPEGSLPGSIYAASERGGCFSVVNWAERVHAMVLSKRSMSIGLVR